MKSIEEAQGSAPCSMGASNPRYRPDIDGLRAVAILSVILFHAKLPSFEGGFVGVDIFFVISGFLIGGIVHRDVISGRFSFANFYARRARRILPALIGMTLIVSLIAIIILPTSLLRDYAISDATALVGISNLRFWYLTHFLAMDWQLDPLVMTWSLGVEEQFYLFLPPLILALCRFAPRSLLLVIAALSACSLALSMLLTMKTPTAAFYLLPGRAWELGTGVLIAVWRDLHPGRFGRHLATTLAVLGLIAIVVSIATFNDETPFPGVAAVLPVFGAGALILAEGSFINTILLASHTARFIGTLSYSWYLWHWPLFAFLRIGFGREPPVFAALTVVILSFVVAFLSLRFLETPFRRPSRLTNPILLRRYVMAIAGNMLLAGSVYLAPSLS